MRPGQVAVYRQGVLPAAAQAPAGAGGLTAETQPEASSTRLALAMTCSTKTLCRFGLPPGDKQGCDTLTLRVTSRRPGAWKARGPDRRRSGGFGLSAKSDTKRMVSPYRGGQRAGCLVSSRPAPLLAGELKVPGLKRVNVGELLARLSFRQEAGDCETYFVGRKGVRCCRTVRQRSMCPGRHDDFPRPRPPKIGTRLLAPQY